MNKAITIVAVFILSISLVSGCIFPEEKIPPEANLWANTTYVNVDEKLTFSANESYDKDGEIIRYFWDFGDGTNATGKYVTHDYENGGNYTVILIVTDDDGQKSIQTISIHVNEMPVPFIEMTPSAYIHEEVTFWANYSYDPDGFITEYFWDFGDGTNGSGMEARHAYSSREEFTVTLTITDNSNAQAVTSLPFEVIFRTYDIEWDTSSHIIYGPEEYSSYEIGHPWGESELITINITKPNLTKVLFNLTWEDDFPLIVEFPVASEEPNDVFVMNVTAPNGEMHQGGPSASEIIQLYIPYSGKWNQLPDDLEMEAESVDILETYLAENFTAYAGTGDWLVNVTLEEAGGARPSEPDIDISNDWTLTVICYYYVPIITKV